MSVVQRVIILNKPFKIRGHTVGQWLLMAGFLVIALIVGSKIPHDWKLGNLPAGFVVGISIFCCSLVLVNAGKMKPLAWWRNKALYLGGVTPIVYLPQREPPIEYPDSSIKEPVKREDQPYVDVERFDDSPR